MAEEATGGSEKLVEYEKLWEDVERRLQSWDKKYPRAHPVVPDTARKGTWKSVRVFVSSTFKDFHNEREVLVKKVFPELRDWCQKRKLHLHECDLRWGCLPGTTDQQTVFLCLEEIDRCYKENIWPFFINLIGMRVGFIPLAAKVGSVFDRYEYLVEGLSVTEMEIVHAAFKINNPNALFLERDSGFLEEIPEKVTECCLPWKKDVNSDDELKRLKSDFQTEEKNKNTDFNAKKQAQKNHLQNRAYFKEENRISKYTCEFDGFITEPIVKYRIQPGTSIMKKTKDKAKKIRLKIEKQFAERVTSFLKERISMCYPLCPHNLSEAAVEPCSKCLSERPSRLQVMDQMHRDFYRSKTELFSGLDEEHGIELFSGRDGELAEVSKFLKDSNVTVPLVIMGESGIGKSAFMAKAVSRAVLNYDEYKHDEDAVEESKHQSVFYHFVGAVPDSTKPFTLLERLHKHLSKDEEVPNKVDELVQGVYSALERSHKTTQYIFIDALNQLDEDDMSTRFTWLPPHLPSCRCVFSLIPKTKEKAIEKRFSEIKKLNLGPLKDKKVVEEIVTNFFKVYCKKLTPDQMKHLLSKKSCTTPLWLLVACEELRIYGFFETLQGKVKLIPDGLSNILQYVMKRLEEEVNQDLPQVALSLLRASKNGLLETEIKIMIGYQTDFITGASKHLHPWADDDTALKLSDNDWAMIYLHLKPLIRPFGQSGEGRLNFYHQALADAVQKRYFKSSLKEMVYHKVLAAYFDHIDAEVDIGTSLERMVENLPFHLLKLKEFDRLADFLCKWKVFDELFHQKYSKTLLGYWAEIQTHKNKGKAEKPAGTHSCMINSYRYVIGELSPLQRHQRLIQVGNLCFQAADYGEAAQLGEDVLRSLYVHFPGDIDKEIEAKQFCGGCLMRSMRPDLSFEDMPNLKQGHEYLRQALDILEKKVQSETVTKELEAQHFELLLDLGQCLATWANHSLRNERADLPVPQDSKVSLEEAARLREEGLVLVEQAKRLADKSPTHTSSFQCLEVEAHLHRGASLEKQEEVYNQIINDSRTRLGQHNNFLVTATDRLATAYEDEGHRLRKERGYDKPIPDAAYAVYKKAYVKFGELYGLLRDIYGRDDVRAAEIRDRTLNPVKIYMYMIDEGVLPKKERINFKI